MPSEFEQVRDLTVAVGSGMIGAAVAGSSIATGGLSGVASLTGGKLIKSAFDNGVSDEDGAYTDAKASVFNVGKEINTNVVPVKVNGFIGKGAELGVGTAVFQSKGDDGTSVSSMKVGANVGASCRGVDVSMEAKPVWVERQSGSAPYGFGVNLDTGFKANNDGVEFSVAGFGFKAGDGFGIKTPFFNFFVKD